MSTIILNILKQVPVPIFGSAAYAVQFGVRKSSLLPRLAPWGVPLGIGALWFVWPAVDEEWKGEMGLVAPQLKETVKIEEKVYRMSSLERKVVEAMKGGDYTYLEKDWEAFQNKASNPNDDDDDEDEEEEEDEDGDGDDGDDDDGDDDGGSDDLAAAEDDDEEDEDEVDAVAEAAKAARISAEEERVLDNIRKGDYTSLEADWDAFQIKASNPNDDDDDEDEDEEEEEEEGGDEEEGEEEDDDE